MAKVMANAALFEQMLMSWSTAMIFLTLDTGSHSSVSLEMCEMSSAGSARVGEGVLTW